ncbi:MAG: EAL domain-containing protein [Pseudohongiellaceae bacterium]|nr:EAL domain-containing protein [Pseudohongiellaceae bacterium]
MNLVLVTRNKESNLSHTVSLMCAKYQWNLISQEPLSADILGDISHYLQLTLVDCTTEADFLSFLEWYSTQNHYRATFGRILLLVPQYNFRQATLVAAYYDVHYLEVREDADQLAQYISTVTGQKENFEDILLSSSANLFAYCLDSSAIISITDSKGKIIYANDLFCNVSGYERQELIGQSHGLIKSGQHGSDFYRHLWETILNGETWRGFICNRNKSGDVYWVDSTITPIFDSSKKIHAFVSIRYDVSEQVKLQEQLVAANERFVISHQYASVGTWDWDIKSGALFWSDEIYKLFGFEEAVTETTYENFLSAIHPSDRELVSASVKDCIENGTPYNVEHRVLHKNGDVRWLSERGHVIRDEKGKAIRMLGVVADIDELKSAQQRAKAQERLTSTFISTLSHEIRNPLNAIAGYTGILESKLAPNPELSCLAAKANGLVAYIAKILDTINLNSRVEKSLDDANIINVDIRVLLEKAVEIALPPQRRERLSIEGGNLNVLADEQYLCQVLVNLLTNADKYNSPEGAIRVSLEMADSSYVIVRVVDQGSGLSKEDIQTIFLPFERLSWAKSEVEGLGLGLAISMNLMQAMNGEIGVESEPGVGSEFWVRLPVGENESLDVDVHDDLPINPDCLPRRVLVLEDNLANQDVIKYQLREYGVFSEAVSNGKLGLELIAQNEYDLILTDINMPEMDGLEFIQRLRDDSENVNCSKPVIVISAANGNKDRGNAYLEAGANDILIKPFTQKDLLKLIESNFNDHCNRPLLALSETSTSSPKIISYKEIDIDVQNDYLAGDSKVKAKLIGIYLDTLRSHIKELSLALSEESLSKVELIAHKLMSSSLCVGAVCLSDKFHRLELAAGARDMVEVSYLVSQVLSCAVQADIELAHIKSNYENSCPTQKTQVPAKDESSIKILIVDDSSVSSSHLSALLDQIATVSYVALNDPREALELLRNTSFDILILDIDMPEIDGIQFIRLFSNIASSISVIAYSNKTELIAPLAELVEDYGLNYLAKLHKPVTLLELSKTLSTVSLPRSKEAGEAKRLSTEEISCAIEQRRIVLHYQPMVAKGKVIAVEALARLSSTDGEIIMPDRFIPWIRSADMEVEFAKLVSEKAIGQLSQWQKEGLSFKVGINFSMFSLEDLSLPNRLQMLCKDFQVSEDNIVIEVTESALSEKPKQATEVLARLKLLGFVLSIDDFGTGYSSLEKLRKLPFSEMKLDRSYVSNARKCAISNALLNSCLGLARRLEMTTVAEGVESKEDFELLKDLGVDLLQGFYIARPMPQERVALWVKNYERA